MAMRLRRDATQPARPKTILSRHGHANMWETFITILNGVVLLALGSAFLWGGWGSPSAGKLGSQPEEHDRRFLRRLRWTALTFLATAVLGSLFVEVTVREVHVIVPLFAWGIVYSFLSGVAGLVLATSTALRYKALSCLREALWAIPAIGLPVWLCAELLGSLIAGGQ